MNVAAVVELHDRVAVPEFTMPLGVIAPHVRSEGAVSVRLTDPAKPFMPVTVIVDVADEPALTGAGLVAVNVKSGTKVIEKVAVAVWVSDPLVPVIVTVNVVAVVEEHDRITLPEPVVLLGVIAPHVSPAGTVSVRLTTPANPF